MNKWDFLQDLSDFCDNPEDDSLMEKVNSYASGHFHRKFLRFEGELILGSFGFGERICSLCHKWTKKNVYIESHVNNPLEFGHAFHPECFPKRIKRKIILKTIFAIDKPLIVALDVIKGRKYWGERLYDQEGDRIHENFIKKRRGMDLEKVLDLPKDIINHISNFEALFEE